MTVTIPYGRTHISMDAPDDRIIRSRIGQLPRIADGAKAVLDAMEHPIGSDRLDELAKGRKNAVIIISDHTRPVPSRDIIPNMLDALRRGNPDIDITLLVATGFHRGTSVDELRRKLGDSIVDNEKIAVHDCRDQNSNVQIGVLPSGAPLVIDRIAAETELLVSEGFIEPHFFAGFSGGRKSVLPGVCSRETVLGNHCGQFIASPYARTGVLEGNPLHRDMVAAAEMAHLQFIVNVIIDEDKHTAAAFAGDFRKAHEAGVSFLRGYCEVGAIPADTVVTSNGGAPLDQNIYQCVKGMTAAEACAGEKGTIIMCAELADGTGGDGFYRSLRDCSSTAELYRKFSETPQSETVPDQWESQILCRILSHHRVIFVTRPEMEQTVKDMKMEYAPDIESALRLAGGETLTVIPDGISVMIKN